MKHRHFREAVAGYLRSRPNEWCSVYALMQVGGAMAWRSRISECRTQLGMRVDCKIERDGNGVAVSYYRFVPKAAPEQARLEMHA